MSLPPYEEMTKLLLPRPSLPSSIEIKDLSKVFKRNGGAPFTAIENVNAVVKNIDDMGEFVTIIGPSGCGKSTILQMIAGFDTHLPATTGSIHFHGDIVTGPSAARGMLFQDYGCYPHLSVFENIAFGLRLHREHLSLRDSDIRNICDEWIERVKLSPKDKPKFPHELSGGMKQRVALARCLTLKPKCLLMDEPFSALDEPTRYEMQDLIIDLWSQIKATIILVSHSISEAVFLGDRIWVISQAPGTIAAEFVDIPKPDPSVPAMVQRTNKKFIDCVSEVSRCFRDVISTQRDRVLPVFADGENDHRFIPLLPRGEKT